MLSIALAIFLRPLLWEHHSTIDPRFFFLTKAFAHVPQFTLRWGDMGKTDFPLLVIQGGSLHSVLSLRFSPQLNLAHKGMAGWSCVAWV